MEYSIHYGLEKVGLPLVLTSEEGMHLCFLIDTGSTSNIIFEFVYNHFKERFVIDNGNQDIMGIEGSLKPTKSVNAELHFDDVAYKSTFQILEANDAVAQIQSETGVQIHGILGIPFLIENECHIDFNNLTIRIQ